MTEDKPVSDTFDAFLRLPPEVYLKKFHDDSKVGALKVDRIEITEDGMFQVLRGVSFLYKGYPHPLHLRAVGVVKKGALGIFRFLASAPYLIPIAYLLRKRILTQFASFSDRVLRDYYLKAQFYMKTGREIDRALGELDWYLRKFIVMFWEYEDTYRFRAQFALSHLNREALRKSPRKEMKRVCDLMAKRELSEDFKKKWKMIKRVITYIPIGFLVDFMLELDIEKFVMDDSDKYFAVMKNDFQYL